MSNIEYLIGSERLAKRVLPVYSDEAINFLSDLSSELLHASNIRAYPDVVSVAYWCRKGNLLKLREVYHSINRLGRGLAFHIAPSNIPVNFVFSYFFSLLAGNANIVRVPSKPFLQVDMICNAFRQVLPQHPQIAERTAFVAYPVNNEITAAFCKEADLRIIWGGDQTVAEMRQYPVKPKCIDIVFADRYSICILNGDAILECTAQDLKNLAENFYNDTYLMDQNACSSPQLILWRNGSNEAQTRFWDAVEKEAGNRYKLQGMTAVEKYIHLCEDAIEYPEIQSFVRQHGNLLYRIQLSELSKVETTALRGKGGYFYEYYLEDLGELCALINAKYQTITYFGVHPEELRQIILNNGLQGVDRIVPIGSAMNIGVFWDGYDIVTMLSRVVCTS